MEEKKGIFRKIKEKLLGYRRVLDIARKPDKEEFIKSTKVTGVGILIVGLVGFIIFLLYFMIVGG